MQGLSEESDFTMPLPGGGSLHAHRRVRPLPEGLAWIEEEMEVDGVLRVPPRNIAALADALLLVLSDCDLATRLAAAGRECADRWTWPRIAEFHAQTYAEVLRAADGDDGHRFHRPFVAGSGIRRGGRKGR